MKNLFILLSFLIINNQLFSQKITVTGSIDPDQVDIADQVTIGFDNDATIAINPDLGEEDLSNLPIFGDFDLRIVQRDKNSYDCMVDTAGNKLVYPNHLETKIDLRSPNNLNPENAYFEIMPNGTFVGFDLDLAEYHTPDARRAYLNLATKAECEDEMFQFYLALPNPMSNPIYIARIVITPLDVNLPPETPFSDIPLFTKLYVHMEQDIISSTSISKEFPKSGIAFPNPTSGKLTLDWCGSAELISISGQRIAIDNSNECTKYFNLDHLPSGPYYMKLSDEKNRYQMTLKLIKM